MLYLGVRVHVDIGPIDGRSISLRVATFSELAERCSGSALTSDVECCNRRSLDFFFI